MSKYVVLSILALTVAGSAVAAPLVPHFRPQTIVDCYSEETGTQLTITSQVVEGGGPVLRGLLTEESFGDSRVYTHYNVRLVPHDPRLMGAPVRYQGDKDFNLEIAVDTMPVHGKIRSHFSGEGFGGRVNEDMLCSLVRQ